MKTLLLLCSIIAAALGHSQMRCAKYDVATKTCLASIRNEGYSFVTESYRYTPGSPICEHAWKNPISSYYSNGESCPDWAPCPGRMGTYTNGEVFTVMWWARNHATAEQNPATVFIYLSPTESLNQGADVSKAAMEANLLCQAPYMSCNGQNGNEVPCTLSCQIPANTPKGIYTLWWKWIWQGETFATCADINVIANGGDPPSTPLTTSKKADVPVSTTKALLTTGAKQNVPSTTGKKSTTGAKTPTKPSTTGSVTTGAQSQAPPTTTCELGQEVCFGANSYKSCYRSSATTTDWSPPRSCQAGLVCKKSHIEGHVLCDRP